MSKRVIGPFQLERQIGVGGMGVVYLAQYVKTGQSVAVKVLSPALSASKQLVARFEREMDILKKLKHPNIVRYFGGGKTGSQQFYAMELMNGGSLERIVRKKGRLSWEQTIDYGVQICSALEHSHNHGIVHRDLKPANLFLTKEGKLKLGDFGIARDTERTALTAAGRTVGTYAYMAPEQIAGKPPVSRKTDLYALGCVLFEMLTGRTPFEAETAAEMLMQHLHEEPPRVTALAIDCPAPLEAVIMRLLEKDPEDRYYDALATLVALKEVPQKVAEQTSIAKQTLSGGQTAGATQGDQAELQKLLGKKKKKKKKGPFYEQVWFLSACLVMLVAGVAWALWPLSEDELLARAEVLMQSEEVVDHQTARQKYLEPLLARFPDGQHATQAQTWLDQIETDKVRRQVETNRRIGRDPKSEAERLYVEARNFEEFGDRLTAIEKYRSLIELLKGREQDRPFVNLSRQQIAELEQKGTADDDRLRVVMDALERADDLVRRGLKLQAQNIWNSVITLYGSNREFEPQVKYARARLTGREVAPLNLDDPDEPASPDEDEDS